MEYYLVKYLLAIIWLVSLVGQTHSNENGSAAAEGSAAADSRQPRMLGRIVKMYSGNKPEPIHCDGEGFKSDPADCAVFYRCVKAGKGKFTVYRFECGPGTIYDPETEVCNHPKSTKRSECGRNLAPSNIELNNENEISETYNEVPSPISTREPIFIAPSTKKNTHVSSTKYPFVTKPQKQVPYTSTTSAVMSSTKSQNYSPSNSPLVTRRPAKQEGNQCDSDGFMGDSENCRKFYRCVNNGRGGYIRYEFSCSESTIWDDETQACNHPWAVQKRRCGRGASENEQSSNENIVPTNSDSNPGESVQEQVQISYGTKVTQSQTQISNGPVKQNQTQINYGNKENPKQTQDVKQNQTQISTGSSVSQTQTQINYGDKGVQTQLQIDHSKQNSQTQSQTYESTPSPVQSSQQNLNDNQPEKENNENRCTKSGFMADSSNCKNFYRCVENGRGDYIKYEFSCGEGTVWDPKIESCNHAWAVKECGSNVESATQSSSEPTLTTVLQQSTSYSTTTTESGNEQESLSSQKPKPETSSQPSTEDQDYDTGYNQPNNNDSTPKTTTSTSPRPVNVNNECKESGFMGDSNDCKKFYRCVDNGNGGFTRYEFSCGEGTVWDSEIEGCNHAWAVKKCGGSIESSPQNTNATPTDTYYSSTTSRQPEISPTQTPSNDQEPDSGYGQQNNDEPPMTSSTTNSPPQQNQNNNCKESGFIGDPTDCNKFYRCVDNGKGGFTRYEFSCGEGTVWDSEIDSCNHAWAVKKCGSQTGTAQSANTTSTENYQTSLSSSSSETPSQVVMIDPDDESGYGQPNDNGSGTSTTLKPTDNQNSCKESGFMGDSKDCKKFYRCVDNGNDGFTRYEFSCGEGTVWDSEIEACNHAWAVEKCGKTDAQKEETNNLNDESNSNQHTTQSQNENESSQSSAATTPSESESTTPKNTQSSSPSKNECSSEGFMGDKQDCKKFYRCVDNGKGGYTKYDFNCGEGTVWDQEIQACNHPSSESCKSNNMQQSNSETESSTQPISSTSNSETSTTETHSTSAETSSKDECQSEGFYANRENCKKFYRCVDNGKGSFTKYDFSCGEGTAWVQEIQACDHDNDINNCNKNTNNTTATSTNEPQSSSETNTPLSSTTEKSEDRPPTSTTEKDNKPHQENDETSSSTNKPSSTEKCSSDGFYPDKNDCTNFYRCVDDGNGGYTKYDFTCGEGTAWDQDIQACNHKNEVSSCSTSIEQTNNNNDNNNSDNMPLDDQQGSQTTETTTTSKSSTTTMATSSSESSNSEKGKCNQEGYFGNSEDCKKFYRCVDDGKGGYTKYDFTCGEGTIWDQDVTTCNHPQDVTNPSCESKDSSSSSSSSSTSSTTSASTSSGSDQTSSSTEGNAQNSSNCSQEDSSKKPQNKRVNCTKAGFYSDPDDCKKFYRCVDWDGDGQRFSVFHFDCGEGTIWDPELETCNYEDSVYPPRDCSGSQSQSETPQESSSEGTTKKQDETTTQSTTTEQSTSEQPTTQQITSEQTTTQQSTTNEQTTTQPSTTSEPNTTQQSTTSEQTTTQQSTSSEQTTTQQSTTSERTTTQQSTSSEQTTTQQSTTSEQTTTQQSTSSEQTTTQQPTTSEQTTTQQSTSSEQTTTQQSTTSEQTTTQQTTSEQTTTQQSTTNEPTTTQQSNTSEQTTTQQPTTTQETTTSEKTTTEQPTKDTTTTETSSTEQQTTTEQMSSGTTSSSSETSTTENEQVTTENTSPSKDCPETEDDQYTYVCPTSFRRHPKYCNMFYQCTEDDESHDVKVAHFNCPNNTIYDESKTQCVEEGKADKKCDGEIAQIRRVKRLDADTKEPIVVSKDKHTCPAVGHFPFEKFDQCSSAFLKCQNTKSGKLRGYVYRCPDNYVYWSISRRCELKSNIKDCMHTANIYNGRWEVPVERRNVAPVNEAL